MRAPYGLNIMDNCLSCHVREEHLFCNLPLPALIHCGISEIRPRAAEVLGISREGLRTKLQRLQIFPESDPVP
jgi:hypothetical protein